MKENYTEKMLQTLYIKPIDKDILTTDITGMTVSIRKASNRNAITFRCRKSIKGLRRDYVLGKFPEMSLTQARKKYLEYIELLARGIDPEQPEQSAVKIVTFGELWREYRLVHDTQIAERTRKKYDSAWSAYLYILDKKDIRAITPDFVMNFMRPLIESQNFTTVQKLASMIRAIVDYAVFKQILEFNSLTKITHYLPKPKINHYVCFSDKTMQEDLVGVFKAMSDAPKVQQLLFYMYFFTLLRSVELRRLKISDLDLNENTFTVKTKTLEAFTQPLTTHARQVVDYLIEHHQADYRPYLFEGTAEDGIISENTINKNLKTRGYGDKLKVHGIRSCARQWLQVQPNIKESVIELCLSHVVGSQVVQAYNRGEYLESRLEALQLWSDFVVKCAGDNFTNLLKN